MAPNRMVEVGPANAESFEYSWKCPELQAHLLSDAGEKREHNEDGCMLCIPQDAPRVHDRGRLFAVADGMGGVSGGALASKLALQSIAEIYLNGPYGHAIPSRLRDAIREANRRVFEEAENRPEYYGMGTTVSAVVVHGSNAYVAHVGDSRVYLNRKGEGMYQVTQPGGTAYYPLRGLPVTVAAKTGSAQVSSDRNIPAHSIFVCYAPCENPVIALAVVVEYGEYGALSGTPVAQEIFEYYFRDLREGVEDPA